MLPIPVAKNLGLIDNLIHLSWQVRPRKAMLA